jgi:DNA-binding beta-propeller fold protein YncE
VKLKAFSILLLLSLLATTGFAFPGTSGKGHITHEIWVTDQAKDSIYIVNGTTHKIDHTLTPKDGVGGNPHMLVFDNAGEYAYVANMETGDMSVIRASDRTIIETIKTEPGAHAALPTNNRDKVIVANTPSRSLSIIETDVENEEFTLIETVNIEEKYEILQDSERFPAPTPVCHFFTADDSHFYVTLGGGGLLVIETETLNLVKAYDKNVVAPHGCGLILSPDETKMYANAGSDKLGELYVFDTETHELLKTVDTRGFDAHGVAITPDEQNLWVVNRASNNASIFDLETNEIINQVSYVGDSPDLMKFSPNGQWAYVTTRGPKPATGTHMIAGDRPGLSIINTNSLKKVKLLDMPDGDIHGIDVRVINRR